MPRIEVGQREASLFRADVQSFNEQLSRTAAAYMGSAADYLKEVALEFISRVVEYTPVDTGRAAMGWYAGAEQLGAANLVAKRADEGASSNPAEQEKGKDEGRYAEMLKGHRLWIEIANGVPYILALELGTSAQGGHRMVGRALAEIKAGLAEGWRRFRDGRE